jgi:hypothetical protein
MTIIQDKYIVQNHLKTMLNGTSINTCPHLAYMRHIGFMESKLLWFLPKKDGRKQMEKRYKPKNIHRSWGIGGGKFLHLLVMSERDLIPYLQA